MGCLNSGQGFSHWFGNIHFSGPCNRSCYFCIGQHMMALDPYNNLDEWPLKNLDQFVRLCKSRRVGEIFLTGSNTDPLLYVHLNKLVNYLRYNMPGIKLGIRTNGIARSKWDYLYNFDKGSLTICSFNDEINNKMMGGDPAPLGEIVKRLSNLKLNIVLGPENTENDDWLETVYYAGLYGIKRVNLREPYGQAHVGNPVDKWMDNTVVIEQVHGMPTYEIHEVKVTYWDVHYVEVESVNLYANGRVSETYPISEGHSDAGVVLDQSHFRHGRIIKQWQYDE